MLLKKINKLSIILGVLVILTAALLFTLYILYTGLNNKAAPLSDPIIFANQLDTSKRFQYQLYKNGKVEIRVSDKNKANQTTYTYNSKALYYLLYSNKLTGFSLYNGTPIILVIDNEEDKYTLAKITTSLFNRHEVVILDSDEMPLKLVPHENFLYLVSGENEYDCNLSIKEYNTLIGTLEQKNSSVYCNLMDTTQLNGTLLFLERNDIAHRYTLYTFDPNSENLLKNHGDLVLGTYLYYDFFTLHEDYNDDSIYILSFGEKSDSRRIKPISDLLVYKLGDTNIERVDLSQTPLLPVDAELDFYGKIRVSSEYSYSDENDTKLRSLSFELTNNGYLLSNEDITINITADSYKEVYKDLNLLLNYASLYSRNNIGYGGGGRPFYGVSLKIIQPSSGKIDFIVSYFGFPKIIDSIDDDVFIISKNTYLDDTLFSSSGIKDLYTKRYPSVYSSWNITRYNDDLTDFIVKDSGGDGCGGGISYKKYTHGTFKDYGSFGFGCAGLGRAYLEETDNYLYYANTKALPDFSDEAWEKITNKENLPAYYLSYVIYELRRLNLNSGEDIVILDLNKYHNPIREVLLSTYNEEPHLELVVYDLVQNIFVKKLIVDYKTGAVTTLPVY